MRKLIPAVLGATVLSLASASGFTQTGPRPEGRPGEPGQRMERPFSKPTERVEARLAYVKTALKINDRQQPQWDAYAALARKSAKEMEDRFAQFRSQRGQRPGPGQRPSAIERLERQQTMHANAIVRLNELLAVQKPLYAALSPEQQKVADVVLNGSEMRGPGGTGGRVGRFGPREGHRAERDGFRRG